ncbi:hypothetical protein AB1L30_05060 [Bremerella sp. JC817]|uniref:hypothetical protein n=1 Tax=Bremerella sp. JC817 TaxID=3231756 RepID=UPI0034574E81
MKRTLPQLVFLLLVVGFLCSRERPANGQTLPEASTSSTVGIPSVLRDVEIPGPLLETRPIENSMTPVVVRVLAAKRADQGFRYDFEYYALEPGQHNLIDYLTPAEGEPLAEPSELWVQVTSELTENQSLSLQGILFRATSWFRTYTVLFWMAVIGWIAGLVWILRVGKKKEAPAVAPQQIQTPWARLQEKIGHKPIEELTGSEKAEIERLVYTIWYRLKGSDQSASEAFVALKQDPDAGPMLLKLEQWLHVPAGEAIDLDDVLRQLRHQQPRDEASSPLPNGAKEAMGAS